MFGIVGTFVRGLLGGLAISIPELVRRVLISLGVGSVVFTGMTVLLNSIEMQILSGFTSLPPIVANIAGLLEMDTFVTVILSALSVRVTLVTFGGLNPKQLKLL